MKKTRIFNILLILLASLIGIGYSIQSPNIYSFLIRISIIPVVLIPFILNKLLKFNISPIVELIYLVFVFAAHLLGSIVNLYGIVPYYDKLIHFSSGVLTALLGLIILIKTKNFDSKKIFLNILFIIGVTTTVALLWEMFEFTSDIIFNKDAQNVLTTGINDTMQDMIVAFLGSVLVSVMYAYEYIENKSIVIKRFIKGVNFNEK